MISSKPAACPPSASGVTQLSWWPRMPHTFPRWLLGWGTTLVENFLSFSPAFWWFAYCLEVGTLSYLVIFLALIGCSCVVGVVREEEKIVVCSGGYQWSVSVFWSFFVFLHSRGKMKLLSLIVLWHLKAVSDVKQKFAFCVFSSKWEINHLLDPVLLPS